MFGSTSFETEFAVGKKRRKSDADAKRQAEQAMIVPRLALIARAFDGVPPPDPAHRTLRQAEARDPDQLRGQAHDHDEAWQDLRDDDIRDSRWRPTTGPPSTNSSSIPPGIGSPG